MSASEDEDGAAGGPAGGTVAAAATPSTFAIEPFDKNKSKWSRWVKRFERALEIFGIGRPKRKSMLLHFMGIETYNVLCDHLSPDDPEDRTYAEIVTLLEQYFDPEPLEMVELWKFRQRMQRDGETVADYVTALQRDAKYCGFGDYLQNGLRNQLVFGLHNQRIRTRLIEEKGLTFERAKQIALSMEASGEGAEVLNRRMQEVHLVDKRKPRRDAATTPAAKVTNPTNKCMCFRCGSEAHLADKCEHKNKICGLCKKKGHLKRVCLSSSAKYRQLDDNKNRSKKHATNLVENNEGSGTECSDEDGVYVLDVCKVGNKFDNLSKIYLRIKVEKSIIKFEVDSGSPVSLISSTDKDKYLSNLSLQPTDIELRSYCGNKIGVLGVIETKVLYGDKDNHLRLFVVEGKRHPLLGREWMRSLSLDWNDILGGSVNSVDKITLHPPRPTAVKRLIDEFSSVFDNSIGKIEGIQAALHLKANSKPVFLKARTLPFSIRDAVEKEIKTLVESGVLLKVDRSEWATPVVPVMKSGGKIRLCGDYKLTLNKSLLIDEHPLPTINEMFANMAGGQKFSKLDLSQAYMQMSVKQEDQFMLTLNTHLGLFQPTRLMYGVASAPAIFQRQISQILQGIPGVTVFLDDVKVTGPDDETHLRRLREVLRRLHEHNMRVNASKCEFFSDSIEYCGYVIDRQGIHKMQKKIDAIQMMPRPENREQVRAFLGLVNYYGRFMRNLSTKLYPINNLLKDKTPFVWTTACEEAFLWVKREMQSESLLVHYDVNLPLLLATDASPYGVGAVLSHLYPDGSERPIQYASQTLNATQQRYSQIDKEAYAIIFGVRKFYQYLFGRKFVLITDNKPVVQIFSPSKGLPTLCALRMQHYAVFLESFDFEIHYRASKDHGNADGMSRLPVPDRSNRNVVEEVDIVEINQIETLPVNTKELGEYTMADKSVKELIQALKAGRAIQGCHRFGIEQNEFGMQGSCLMRGIRVYVPPSLRGRVLNELHSGHFGISRMKSLARSYCWWENIDRDIEEIARNCVDCARAKASPAKVQIHCWEQPSEPFQRIHADFAGPFMGLYFLVIVDAHSKWPEIKIIPDLTTSTTIEKMREYFATFGLPSILVTDRGTQFTSDQFQHFLKKNGIVHKMGAPYHPATNGQAERYVQTFKDKIKALKCSRSDVQKELQQMLMAYRRTPHPATGKSPSLIVFGRQIKSRIDLMIPSEQTLSNFSREGDKPVRSFSVNDRIAARDYTSLSEKWRFGVVVEKVGKLHYMVQLDDGRMWKRHIDQLRQGPILQERHPEIRNTTHIQRSRNSSSPSRYYKFPDPVKVELEDTDDDVARNTESPTESDHIGQNTPLSAAINDTDEEDYNHLKRVHGPYYSQCQGLAELQRRENCKDLGHY
ncbi:uncharacterized protein K02A2.6-like [Malaya genurostris]|uniref:uncharacterized protein K02A2.6-like n=1 Tax=Malaya genurostris TaxID=325434 RepID=UPI0026F3C73E|nr:uncharacterized protein K02A2.6-like [Malaya genurostris]